MTVILDLTPMRERVLAYIIEYKARHDGCAPSMREICDAVHLASTSSVSTHLEKLERDGMIRIRVKGESRSIEVIGGMWKFESVKEEA